MNKKLKLTLLIISIIVVIGGASLLYNTLTKSNTTSDSTLPDNPKSEAYTNIDAYIIPPSKRVLAESLELKDRSGNTVSLEDFKGNPVVLNFWASWCPPCKEEMPYFQKAYDTHGSQINFAMVNITDGSRETLSTAKTFINSEGYAFPVYFDMEAKGAQDYMINSIPTTYFIDSTGYTVAIIIGSLSQEKLDATIKYLLESL